MTTMADLPRTLTTGNVSDRLVVHSNTSHNVVTSDSLVSSQALWVFQWICYGAICQTVGLFGTVTNIINIICFVKQGFKDSVNISLLGLTISDLGSLLMLIWLSMALIPVFEEADLPFSPVEIDYLTGGWPHVAFSRITSWITALITLERCLCISIPLKVKVIVTRRRTVVALITVYIFLVGSVSPVYCVNRFAMKFYPDRNKTILGLVFTEDRENVEKVSFAINNVIIPFTAFVVILISTITLVIKLQSKTKWRKTSMCTGHSDSISHRDRMLAKMIVIISALFIACFSPICIIFVGMILEPELAIEGQYRSLFLVVSGIGFISESMNSTVNIFIYYFMSSRYRTVFRKLFRLSSDEKGKIAK